MRRNIASSVLAMAWLSTTAVAALQEQGPTVADRFKALVHEYETITGGRVDSDEERLKVIARVFQRRSELGLQLVELAESHPKDPLAIDALIQAVWQVNTNPWPVEVAGQDPVAAKALALLERDHLQSDRLGPLCQRISHGFREEYEKFLRAAATSAVPAVGASRASRWRASSPIARSGSTRSACSRSASRTSRDSSGATTSSAC